MSIYKPHGKWVLTDDDWLQVRRQFYEGCDDLWQFAEIRERFDGKGNYWFDVVSEVINLNDFDEEARKDVLCTYGYTIEDYWNSMDLVNANGQLAEMFFENSSGSEWYHFETFNDAIAYLERWTGLDLSQYKE